MQEREIQRYVGRQVEIIYLDRADHISQRRIKVRSVSGGTIKAFDEGCKAPRNFAADRVLAALPHKYPH